MIQWSVVSALYFLRLTSGRSIYCLKARAKAFNICFNIIRSILLNHVDCWVGKPFQHRFNFDSTCFNAVERGGGVGGKLTVSTSLFNKIERILKQMMKPFRRALILFWVVWTAKYTKRNSTTMGAFHLHCFQFDSELKYFSGTKKCFEMKIF